MADPLSDCSPLISAAASCKLRLVRLLVEGGSQVNGCNPRGETPLLAACKALRGEPDGPATVKLLTYLLHNKADPNAQDWAGRTALMYACMARAGAEVASTLLAAGADPCTEDYWGASALVYAINAQHQPTLKMLVDACRARGREIIIITTETGASGGQVSRHYLNVTPPPDTLPVPCMSPSDIVLKTGSPNSPEAENVFNFRGTGNRGSSSSRHPSCELSPFSQCSTPPSRQRVLSEPWLAIHNLARLNRTYEEGVRERGLLEEGGGEDSRRERGVRGDEGPRCHQSRMEERSTAQRRDNRHGGEDFLPRLSQSVLSLTETSRRVPKTWNHRTPRSCVDELPACSSPHSQLRRNTLPSLMVVPPPPHLPPLVDPSNSLLRVPFRDSTSKSRSMGFLPHPPSSSSTASVRPPLLPRPPLASSFTSLIAAPASCCSERSRRSPRRHSVQLEQIGRGGGGETI